MYQIRFYIDLLRLSLMRCLYPGSLGILLVLGAANVFAEEDPYLKMLEGEAESLELDPSGQLQNTLPEPDVAESARPSGFGWTGMLEGDRLPSGLSHDRFELMLKENFFGTYVFYRRLNSTDRRTVYYRYTKAESTSLENVRKDILELLKR